MFTATIKLSQVTKYTISQLKDGKFQFRNYVDKDEFIESWMIEKEPDVKKGDLVKAIVKKSKITLTLDARILENGNVGEQIKLKLNKNKRYC